VNKIVLYFVINVLLASTYGCAFFRDSPPAIDARQRTSSEDAQVLIDELLPDREWEIREMTADALWNEMGVQLFTNVSAEQYEYVFAITGDTARILKHHWGAYYFDYALADMDGDGQKEMLYIYDWGSGIVRSEMGVLKPDGSIAEIIPTEEATGIWSIRKPQTEHDGITCEVTSAMGESGAKKGLCIYENDGYVFDIEE